MVKFLLDGDCFKYLGSRQLRLPLKGYRTLQHKLRMNP
jgi:hypothetical protein